MPECRLLYQVYYICYAKRSVIHFAFLFFPQFKFKHVAKENRNLRILENCYENCLTCSLLLNSHKLNNSYLPDWLGDDFATFSSVFSVTVDMRKHVFFKKRKKEKKRTEWKIRKNAFSP